MSQTTRPVHIFLADDHGLMNEGLARLLQEHPAFHVAGAFNNASTLLERLHFEVPDLVISDIAMPGMNGLELATVIRTKYPEVRILLLTMHLTRQWVKAAMQSGAHGYMLKDSGLEEMIQAIEAVMKGERYVSRKAALALLEEEQEGTRITNRENEILQMLARGLTTKEIADKLCVSNYTIESHRKNMLAKTGVSNTAELIVWGVGEGFINVNRRKD